MKAARRKTVTYKGIRIKLTADFSSETMEARKQWDKISEVLTEQNDQRGILYPLKLSKIKVK